MQPLQPAQNAAPTVNPRPRDEPAREPSDSPVAVLFATAGESGGFEDRLEGLLSIQAAGLKLKQGALAGRPIVVATSGIGAAAARRATELVLDGHRPSWVLSAGYAGGLSPQLARGHFLLANELVDEGQRRLTVDLAIDDEQRRQSPDVHVGRLLLVDRVICDPQEKRALGQRHDALAVDMESLAVAEVCRERPTRFLGVRIISDAVDEPLPPEIAGIARAGHAARRAGLALGALWNRPAAAKDFWKLREQSLVDSDRLAKFLCGLIAQLPR